MVLYGALWQPTVLSVSILCVCVVLAGLIWVLAVFVCTHTCGIHILFRIIITNNPAWIIIVCGGIQILPPNCASICIVVFTWCAVRFNVDSPYYGHSSLKGSSAFDRGLAQENMRSDFSRLTTTVPSSRLYSILPIFVWTRSTASHYDVLAGIVKCARLV